MKTTLTPHLRICPYKGIVATVQIQMPFHAIVRSWTLLPPLIWPKLKCGIWTLYRPYQDEIDEKVVGGQRKNVIVNNNPCHCRDIIFGDISKGDLILFIVAIAEVNSMIVY